MPKTHSKRVSRRALSFARAVRESVEIERKLALAHIREMEEYLGVLRAQFQVLEDRVQQADEQICDTRLSLSMDGITEYSLSDDEDTYPAPPSSDLIQFSNDAGSSSSADYTDDEDYGSSQDFGVDCVGVVEADGLGAAGGIGYAQ